MNIMMTSTRLVIERFLPELQVHQSEPHGNLTFHNNETTVGQGRRYLVFNLLAVTKLHTVPQTG